MARARSKPVGEQVIVITGASSGIGLVTAKEAARRGARVVLVARNELALEHAVKAIEDAGGTAMYVVGDVANPDDMEHVAAEATGAFGGFDTWVNNASTSIYGRLDEVHLDDKRRLFDVAYWGVVHGCRAAMPHLKQRGGTIVNIGSIASDVAIPLLGAYSAAKHAVKGFTDALRIELEHEGVPVAVSLVKPASVDTMFFVHARNYMDVEPNPVPPVYAPELVAEAILHCAEHGTRELNVGGSGRAMQLAHDIAPRLMDRYLATTGFTQQRSDRPARDIGNDNLFEFAEDGHERGGYRGHVMERSLYSVVARNPWFSLLAAVGVGAAIALGARGRRSRAAEARELELSEADDATYGTADLPQHEAPGLLVRGDTSLSDAMQRGEVQAAAPAPGPAAGSASPSRGREQSVARPLVAPLADMVGTSTEDVSATSLLDPSRGETSRGDTARGDTARGDMSRTNLSRGDMGNAGREKTDEAWLTLG